MIVDNTQMSAVFGWLQKCHEKTTALKKYPETRSKYIKLAANRLQCRSNEIGV